MPYKSTIHLSSGMLGLYHVGQMMTVAAAVLRLGRIDIPGIGSNKWTSIRSALNLADHVFMNFDR